MTVIAHTKRYINLQGLDNHEVNELKIVSCVAVAESQKGPVVLIFHQYANLGKGKSIHSSGQLEYYRKYVNDKSHKVEGGKELIKILDGYLFPVYICSGFSYLNMHPVTEEDQANYPQLS